MNYKEIYKYGIFKYAVSDDNFFIFDLNECPNIGFSSLYSYTKETAEAFETSGFKTYKGVVWSEALAVDFDDQEAGSAAIARLTTLGLKFEVWSTGNRGVHIYIDRPHAPSHILPKIDKDWVSRNLKGADLSIYHNVAMFRRPGARHDKTGNRKTLIKQYPGTPLLLADTLEEVKPTSIQGARARKSIFVDALIMGYTVPHTEGGRHEALLALGLAMKRQGEPLEFISRWLYHANLLFTEPKSMEELERIIMFVHQAITSNEENL